MAALPSSVRTRSTSVWIRQCQVQAGASLIFDVLREFDPQNLLLRQSEAEVLDRQFEEGRLARTLERLEAGPLLVREPARPTPLGLPLVADRLGTTLSTESVLARLAAMGVLPPGAAPR
ncbi:MAG: hypothetical protein ACO3IB_06950 [Phycisphaerales bacterium]